MKLIVAICLALVSACGSGAASSQASATLPPEWSVHDAAGLRIAAPSLWGTPQVLPATASSGPRTWIVFRDPSGTEALTIMTWRDETASALAAAQYESERPRGDAPTERRLAEGTLSRTVIAMSGYAQWSDSTGSGTYECRHLYVQVDPRLVAVVIACGPHLKGSTTPAPQLRQMQEQVALRLGIAGSAP